MRTNSRKLLIGMALGIAVFAGISIYADVEQLGDRLANFGWWAFAAALGLALLNYLLRFVRWTLYLRTAELEVPPGTSALVFVSGFALSVTPGKVGELIKSYLLRQNPGIPVARSAPVVVAERVTDLLALLVLGVIGVAVYGIAREVVVGAGAIIGFGLLVLAWPRLGHGVISLICRPRRLQPLGGRLLEFYNGLVALSRPVTLTWATALAVVAWLGECIGFALIVSAFPGTGVPLGMAMLIYAATTIAGALSFLPGGLVVTEAAMTALLVSNGIDEASAAAATILTRLATLWFAVLLGITALTIFRRQNPSVPD